MNDEQIGRLIAAVRRHVGWRQKDLADAANVDQKVVSLLENGRLERVSVVRFRRVCAALTIEPVLDVRWRGGLGYCLIDREHAQIVEQVTAALTRDGWETIPEFTFNVYGERGSVDIVAWHPVYRALLIVEVKTKLTDLQRLLMTMSRKIRVVPGAVEEERGWRRRSLGRLVVVSGTRANRAVVARHAATFAATFPGGSLETRRWLRTPVGDYAGLWFVAARREPPASSDLPRRARVGRPRPTAESPRQRRTQAAES